MYAGTGSTNIRNLAASSCPNQILPPSLNKGAEYVALVGICVTNYLFPKNDTLLFSGGGVACY